MPQTKESDRVTVRTMRQKAHDRLDTLLDIAEGEQLWGSIKPDILIQAGKIVKLDFEASLGEKATAS